MSIGLTLVVAITAAVPGASSGPYEGNTRPAQAAFGSCVTEGIRAAEDGKRDPRLVVRAAETRCDQQLTAFVREFRRQPWVCPGYIENDFDDDRRSLSYVAVAECLVKYLKTVREYRIVKLKAYRENHVSY